MDAEDWVRAQIERGRSYEDVRADLREAGWTPQQIDRILEAALPQDLEPAPHAPLTVELPLLGQVERDSVFYAIIFLLMVLLGYGVARILL